jgi:hypothetical protein
MRPQKDRRPRRIDRFDLDAPAAVSLFVTAACIQPKRILVGDVAELRLVGSERNCDTERTLILRVADYWAGHCPS